VSRRVVMRVRRVATRVVRHWSKRCVSEIEKQKERETSPWTATIDRWLEWSSRSRRSCRVESTHKTKESKWGLTIACLSARQRLGLFICSAAAKQDNYAMCRSELKGMLKELTSEGPGSDRPRSVVREKGE
jgi:hypothetical protein